MRVLHPQPLGQSLGAPVQPQAPLKQKATAQLRPQRPQLVGSVRVFVSQRPLPSQSSIPGLQTQVRPLALLTHRAPEQHFRLRLHPAPTRRQAAATSSSGTPMESSPAAPRLMAMRRDVRDPMRRVRVSKRLASMNISIGMSAGAQARNVRDEGERSKPVLWSAVTVLPRRSPPRPELRPHAPRPTVFVDGGPPCSMMSRIPCRPSLCEDARGRLTGSGRGVRGGVAERTAGVGGQGRDSRCERRAQNRFLADDPLRLCP